MKKVSIVVRSLALVGGFIATLALPVLADSGKVPVKRGSEVIHMLHHDTSLPLRDIPPAPHRAGVRREIPNRDVVAEPSNPNEPLTGKLDTAIQMSAGTMATPATNMTFMGIGKGFTGPNGTFTVNSAPPDTVGDVGPNHYVQAVNSDFAVFNKNGAAIYGPVLLNTLWAGFGGRCQTDNSGDPTVNYDQIADRWVIAQFAVDAAPNTECIAVSTSGDPTGAWYRYSYEFTDFNDYPKVAVWPDAYYITYNMWAGSTGYGKVCAHDRAKMLAGQANTMQCFGASTDMLNKQGLLSSEMDGSTQPPAGSANYVIRMNDSVDTLELWKFKVDWANSANSTFTGPVSIPVAAFGASCAAYTRGQCIPQPGTTVKLESLGKEVMNRFAYRNFGAYEALVASHAVGQPAGIRWYELRNPNAATPTVYQSGTYSPNTDYRWMPSIAMDQAGNIGLGYSISNSSSLKPSINYTGRLVSDPLGTMGTEAVMFAGSGSQIKQAGQSLKRWGDYSAMVVDPSDDCTFWYTTEYLPADGIFNWSTRIGSFKFSNCGGPPPPPDTTAPTTSLTAPANGATVTATISVSASASDNVAVTKVEFYAGAALIGTDTTAPYSISWDTTAVSNGSYNLTSKAYDAANNTATSSPVSVTVSNTGAPALTAAYSSTYKAPACGSGGKSCDSGAVLLNGRGNLSGGVEPNQPNTINNSCADGSTGTYHKDESIDRMSIATADSAALASGKSVTISVTVWCFGTTDSLDLYYTSNASSPSWTSLGSQTCTAGGVAKTFTKTYTLPTGANQAVRGNFRYSGAASSCTSGNYNDHDDLVFGVQ